MFFVALFIASSVAMLAFPAAAKESEMHSSNASECVVLLHGMGRTAWSMKPLEFYLRHRGYRVVNISYRSRNFTVEEISENYLAPIVETNCAGSPKIHFITHSLGGIIVRQYLATHSLTNLGAVVMIAPPNHGSAIIDRLLANRFTRFLMGKSAKELGTTEQSLPNRLGEVRFDCGIIAGNRSLNPFLSSYLEGANDGKVTVESARVTGMKQCLELNATHTWIIWRRDVMASCFSYIKSGSFTAA